MEIGQIIGGKYRLRKKIGEGGMGSVWSAVHETLDRSVAIKFLSSSIDGDADSAAARFVAEAKSAARVKHRFVVDVFDFGITEIGEYYMALELLEGEELADCLAHGAAWEAADALQFMAHCLTGLEAVHQAGIVHRDLKPENIFVMRDSDGRYPKLLDFGISKGPEKSQRRGGPSATTRSARPRQITTHGTTIGTPWYMSPEQLRGRRDLDQRADLYSIGVIMYEWFAGRVPYAEENLAELALQIAAGSAPPLVSLRPELGHELSSVVARAMAPEPEGRFASAAELREALLALIPGMPRAWSVVQKAGKAPLTPQLVPGRSRNTEALLVAAADSFGRSHAPGARRLRAPLLGLGGVVLLGLLSLPWLRGAGPERASAEASAIVERAGARAELPTPTSRSEIRVAADAPRPAPSTLPANAAAAAPPAASDEPVDLHASPAPRVERKHHRARHERRRSRGAQRDLVRELDF